MNINEKPHWESEVKLLTRQEKVEGGVGGAANIQASQLANRTQYLKSQIEAYNGLLKSGELPFSSKTDAIAAIAAGKIPDGAIFSVRSDNPLYWVEEFKNIGGVIVDNGKYLPSAISTTPFITPTESDPDGKVTGVAATVEGQYFCVPQSSADSIGVSLNFYLHQNGEATLVESLPGQWAISGLKDLINYVYDVFNARVFGVSDTQYAAGVKFDNGFFAPFMNYDGRLIFVDSDGNEQKAAADADIVNRPLVDMQKYVLADGSVCQKVIISPEGRIVEAWTEDGGYYFETPDGLLRSDTNTVRHLVEMQSYVLADGSECQKVVISPEGRIVEAWTKDGGYYFDTPDGLTRVGNASDIAQKVSYATGVTSSMFLSYGATRISVDNNDDPRPVMYVIPTWGQSLAQGWSTVTGDSLIATTNLYPENMWMFTSARGTGKENPNRAPDQIDTISPLKETIDGGWKETACSSSAAHIIKAVEELTGHRINILRYIAADGGKAFRDLTKGTTVWDKLVQGMIDAKRVCERMGYRLVVLGLDVKAGETDTDGTARLYPELYTRMLMNLDRNFNAEVKRVFGGDHPEVPIYVEQCSWQPNGAWDSRVRQGQLDADGIGNIRFTGASYQYPHTGDVIHINSKGQNSRGVQLARAVVFESFGTGFIPLKAKKAAWSSDNTIDVECTTATSITKDTSGKVINIAGLGEGGGFRVRNKFGDKAELTVRGAEVISAVQPAIIRITLDNPGKEKSVELGYALAETGTVHQAGPIDGARGVFRTSSGMTNLYTGEIEYQWLPAFIMEVN